MKQKKQLSLLRIESFMLEYPILLFLQFNNLSVNDWCVLRTKLQEIEDTKFLIIKNKFTEKILLGDSSFLNRPEKGYNKRLTQDFALQGPNFLLGCKNLTSLKALWLIINETPKILCVGGLYHDKIYTHLDIQKLIELDYSVYVQLLLPINIKSEIYFIFFKKLQFNILVQAQLKLLHCLNSLNEKSVQK